MIRRFLITGIAILAVFDLILMLGLCWAASDRDPS